MKAVILFEFTAESKHAIGLAKHFSQAFDMDLRLVHVINAPSDAMLNDQKETVISVHCNDSVLPDLNDVRKKIADFLGDDGLYQHTDIVIGHKVNSIIQYLNKDEVSLVFYGITPSKGFFEKLEGPYAEKLIAQSPCPVVTLRCDRSDLSLLQLLIVGEFKPQEKHDLAVIRHLVKQHKTQLHLLTVVKNTQTDAKAALQHQKQFAEQNELAAVEFHVQEADSVAHGIMIASDKLNVDFIALGNKQKTGFGRLFSDSTSQRIINQLFKPIISYSIKTN